MEPKRRQGQALALIFVAIAPGIVEDRIAFGEGKIAETRVNAGAGRGTRTPTVSPPADFESAASTNSAIPA